jgi:hypothetical protein
LLGEKVNSSTRLSEDYPSLFLYLYNKILNIRYVKSTHHRNDQLRAE